MERAEPGSWAPAAVFCGAVRADSIPVTEHRGYAMTVVVAAPASSRDYVDMESRDLSVLAGRLGIEPRVWVRVAISSPPDAGGGRPTVARDARSL